MQRHAGRCRSVQVIVGVAVCVTMTIAPPWARAQGRQGRQGGLPGEATRVFLGLGPKPDTEAAKKGEPIFRQQCEACHGVEGRGGQAPSLLRSPLVLHDEKGEAFEPVLRDGRQGMPPFPALTKDDIYSVSQYIHLQVELTANRGTYDASYASLKGRATGDPAQGEAFFRGAGGCVACHSVTGDLVAIGARFPQAATMKARFLWPSSPGPATITVVTSDGQKISGTIKTITDFDVSLMDATGTYRSWPRSRVTVQIDDPLAGHRAMLPRYSDADINNLAAYLVTLR